MSASQWLNGYSPRGPNSVPAVFLLRWVLLQTVTQVILGSMCRWPERLCQPTGRDRGMEFKRKKYRAQRNSQLDVTWLAGPEQVYLCVLSGYLTRIPG